MRIELAYNPCFPLTTLRVDGTLHDSKYSELYPVRNFPLRAWLYRNGAWPGLLKTLENLSRGRETEVVFIGRAVDYADFSQAMEPAKYRLFHRPAYDCAAILEKAEELLRQSSFLFDMPEKTIAEEYRLIQEEAIPDTRLEIHSPEEFARCRDFIERDHLPLIYMDAGLFEITREEIRRILYENLRRPEECVLIRGEPSPEYARGYTVLRDGREEELLLEKYALPYRARFALQKLERTLSLVKRVSSWAKAIHNDNAQLKSRIDQHNEFAEQDSLYEQYDKNAAALEWHRRQKDSAAALEKSIEEALREARKWRN